jgi:alpha-galactosidase
MTARTPGTHALTPPMGWNSWNQVRCYDLTEDVVKAAADALVSTGLREAGYRYVVVDDCWQDHRRDADGNLQAHPVRFPGGIAALATYVHDRGLLFGIYSSPGKDTCAMRYDDYPGSGLGSFGHEEQDAALFASWGVDFLKYDWCLADENAGLEPVPAFSHMRDVLARQGRPIVYSISEYGINQPWTWAHDVANLWRTTADLFDTWASVEAVIDQQADLADHTGRPGAWNDPDMLQIGNGTLTVEENRTHLTLWAILDAPLFLGTDPARLSPENLALVSHREVIEIDQDFAGAQGRRLAARGLHEVWGKPLSDGGFALVLYNRDDTAAVLHADLVEVGLGSGPRTARDVWAQQDVGR